MLELYATSNLFISICKPLTKFYAVPLYRVTKLSILWHSVLTLKLWQLCYDVKTCERCKNISRRKRGESLAELCDCATLVDQNIYNKMCFSWPLFIYIFYKMAYRNFVRANWKTSNLLFKGFNELNWRNMKVLSTTAPELNKKQWVLFGIKCLNPFNLLKK